MSTWTYDLEYWYQLIIILFYIYDLKVPKKYWFRRVQWKENGKGCNAINYVVGDNIPNELRDALEGSELQGSPHMLEQRLIKYDKDGNLYQ